MNLYADLEARGILKQVTDPGLSQALAAGPLSLYAGFDPTADTLHVGSLMPLLTLRRFQLAGHRPIAVVGGATGMIGDPSGKSQERTLMSDEQLEHNVSGIRATVSRLLDMGGKSGALVANNADWTRGFSYLQFLRDVGKHFTVNHMMAKESVRARLEDREHGISYTEFSYMLLQAFDFHVLYRDHGCRLQIGGSEQWGNITAGIDLIHRMNPGRGHAPAFGMTHPLIMKADGTKFGKTESGAVWLDPKRTSPYRFYQFFMQTADADVLTYLNYFTFESLDWVRGLEASIKSAPEKREAQTALARAMTKLVHGDAELARAEKASQALFGEGIRSLDEQTLLDVLGEAPTTRKRRPQAMPSLVDALVDTGLCASRGAAKKDIAAGGIYVNNERVTDPAASLQASHLLAGKHVVLRKGKKTYHLLSFE